MSLWKQILVAAIVVLIAFGGWLRLSPETLPAPVAALFAEAGLASVGVEGGAVTADRGSVAGRGPAGAGPGGPPGRPGGRGGAERVITAAVTEVAAIRRVQAVGTAEAARSVTLFPATAGQVVEVAMATGDSVAQGDILVRLDDREEQIAVEIATIALQSAQDQLGRFERLNRNQTVSTVQVEEARAALARASAQLRAAELELERRNVRAPFDGTVGFPQIHVGDRVTTTTAIVTIDDRREVYVRFAVPERFAGSVKPGLTVTATTVSYGTRIFEGVVADVDSRIDPQARTLTARAAIRNAEDNLRPGMAFLVELLLPGENHVAIPLLSLQWDRDGSFVWQVVDGKARRVNVTIVERGADSALVSANLSPSDRVVLEGVQRLRDGADVIVAETPRGERS